MPDLSLSLRSCRPLLGLALCCLALAGPRAAAQDASAPSQPSDSPHLGLGVRMAYGIQKKEVDEALGPAMGLEGLIAPQVDVSWFFSSHLSLGLYGQYGVGRYSRFCSEESCRGGVLRLGVGLQYQFAPESPWSPWLGAGVGYQRHMKKEHLAYGDTSTVESGFEFMRLEAGLDFTFAGRFRVGPYVTGSMSSYFWRSMKTDGYPSSSTPANSDLEFWVMPGVRFQARL